MSAVDDVRDVQVDAHDEKNSKELAAKMIAAIQDRPVMSESEVEEKWRNTQSVSGDVFHDEKGGWYAKNKHRIPALSLPGFGEGQEDCGAEVPHFCEDCGHVFSVGRTCAQSRCPRCAPRWVTKTAPGHVNNIQGAARMMSAQDDYNAVYKHHVSINVDPSSIYYDADDPLEEAIGTIHDLLDIWGAQGYIYYHPWKGKDGDDRGKWKDRLFQPGVDWEDVRDELRHMPHFHVVVACPWIPGGKVTRMVERETGWVISRHTERNGSAVSLGDMESVARAVSYTLSHTGIDCRGDGHNRAIMRPHGSAIHAADDRDLEEARDMVRQVASGEKGTLGISWGEVECKTRVPADMASDSHDHDHTSTDDGSSTDGDDGDVEATAETDQLVKCSGKACDVRDADDYLADEDWRNQALFVGVLEDVTDTWNDVGGWRGWIEEQPEIPPPVPDHQLGDPPPG